MGALSPWHIILIALVALLLFGPNKLPELGRGFGKMFREFKEATSGNGSSSDETTPTPKKNCMRLPRILAISIPNNYELN